MKYRITCASVKQLVMLCAFCMLASCDTAIVNTDVIQDDSNASGPVFRDTSVSTSVAEGTTTVISDSFLASIDTDTKDSNTYVENLTSRITGGEDKDAFSLELIRTANYQASYRLRFLQIPDYENPHDSNKDNRYELTVSIADSNGRVTSQDVRVIVTDIDDALYVEGGVSSQIDLQFEENTDITYTLVIHSHKAQDLTPWLQGIDSSLFSIDTAIDPDNSHKLIATLSAKNVLDYENPQDENEDNIYEVVIFASDNAQTVSQTLAITIQNVNDNLPKTSDNSALLVELYVQENTHIDHDFRVTDLDGADTLSVHLEGKDSDLFTFAMNKTNDTITVLPSFRQAPNFANPQDSDQDNRYEIVIVVSDGNNEVRQNMHIHVHKISQYKPVLAQNTNSFVNLPNTENTFLVRHVLRVSDLDGLDTLSASLEGIDSALFAIDTSVSDTYFHITPRLIETLDFENPQDANKDNMYEFMIVVSDGVDSVNQTIFVTVSNSNDNSPTLVEGQSLSVDLQTLENTNINHTLSVFDADGVDSFFVSLEGEDSDAFKLVNTTVRDNIFSNSLIFITFPDYENPSDADQDNVYRVTITMSDGKHSISQNIVVAVVDVLQQPTIGKPENLAVEIVNTRQLILRWDYVSESSPHHFSVSMQASSGTGFTEIAMIDDYAAREYTLSLSGQIWEPESLQYIVSACSASNQCVGSLPIQVEQPVINSLITYTKASNIGAYDKFGESIALSRDGNILAVGALGEDGGSRLNMDDSVNASGAVYVYSRNDGVWSTPVYVKAPDIGENDQFGSSIAISADGRTLAVGAIGEDGNGKGVNPSVNNSLNSSGAVYVYTRTNSVGGSVWGNVYYLKATEPGLHDEFGTIVTLSQDGNTLVISTHIEKGDIYVYTRTDGVWSYQTRIAAGEGFGHAVALSQDGKTLAISSYYQQLVYVYTYANGSWGNKKEIRGYGVDDLDSFGWSLALSGNGNILAVGLIDEDGSSGTGESLNNNAKSSGAVHIYTRVDGKWDTDPSYIKALNVQAGDLFGHAVSLSEDGNTLAVSALGEDGGGKGIQPNFDENASNSGAVYTYTRVHNQSGYYLWSNSVRYIKSTRTATNNKFGSSVILSADGSTLAVSALGEDGGGIDSGSVYVY